MIPLALYIHMPWCIQKCPYCDFNSHATQNKPFDEDAYIDALLDDLQKELPAIWGRRLISIFIGGGTPSLFSAKAIERLLQGVQTLLPFSFDMLEITMEANPGTFELQKFKDFKAAGINRMSLGVQSFNDAQLKKLGRIHSSLEACRALEALHNLDLNSFNLDIMYGLPEQDLPQALEDLQQALKFMPPHLSWYHLTLEPNTQFYRQPPKGLPDDDFIFELEQQGRTLIKQHSFEHYEVSAYSQAGMQCQHNLNYWTFGDYLGIGAGAHSKITDMQSGQIKRFNKQRVPQNYLNPELPYTSGERVLEPEELPLEFMMNALRLQQPFALSLFSERTLQPFGPIQPMLSTGQEQGLLQLDAETLATTKLGQHFLNNTINLFNIT
jgi:oxygen-independent coproporphyrinogen-3 oxidase